LEAPTSFKDERLTTLGEGTVKSEKIREYFLSSQETLTQMDYDLTADGELFELAVHVEEELVDDYVVGRLSVSEEEAFEMNYLVSDARRDKVAHAKRLLDLARKGAVDRNDASYGSLPRFMVTAAICLSLIVVSMGLYFLVTQEVKGPEVVTGVVQPSVETDAPPSRGVSKDAPASVSDAGDDKDVTAKKKPDDRPSRVTPAMVTLSPTNFRSGGREIVLSQEETRVPFLMKLLTEPGARTFSNYAVAIETPEGTAVTTSSTILSIAKSGVTVSVVGRFEGGTYIVYLSGVDAEGTRQPVAEYAFRVM